MAVHRSSGMPFLPVTQLETKDEGTPMTFDNAIARPRSDSTQIFNSMHRSLSYGYTLSISNGHYPHLTAGYLIPAMQTVFETRRTRLGILVKKHGTVANLNRALDWEETNARLYQIHNRSIRADRGTLYEMGDPTAREIEEKLSLGLGWMDTPPSYAELHGEEDPRTKVLLLMESMPPDQWPTAVRLLDALAQPAQGTGTNGKQ